MKVLFVARRLVRAGAERQLVVLAGELSRAGHEVVVATFRPGPQDSVLPALGVRHVLLGGRGGRLLLPWRLARLARTLRPDVIHGYLDAPNILAGLTARFARPARAVWGLRASELVVNDLPLPARVLYKIDPWVARMAALIIVNSQAGYETAIARGYPRARLVVIPNGVDSDHFRDDAEAGRRFRSELGIASDALVVTRVGRLHPMKDYETFLDAVARLRDRHPKLVAVCCGDGPTPYAQALRARATQLGLADVVVWCPASDEMPGLYAASDLLVSSSAYGEGFPNVVVEAMACEVPCVVTDVGDSARILGVPPTGAVVPPRDSGAMADAIDEFVSRSAAERRTIGRLARKRVAEEYTVACLGARTIEALATLLQSSKVS